MADDRITLCELFGFVGKWLEEKSFPIAKVGYKDTIVEGQVSIKRISAPSFIFKALPTEIDVGGKEIPLDRIKSIEMDGTRYIINENNE